MPRVSTRGQITLSAEQCRGAGIAPGDEYGCFVDEGRITIIRQSQDSAWGCLKHLSANRSVSDEALRQDAIESG